MPRTEPPPPIPDPHTGARPPQRTPLPRPHPHLQAPPMACPTSNHRIPSSWPCPPTVVSHRRGRAPNRWIPPPRPCRDADECHLASPAPSPCARRTKHLRSMIQPPHAMIPTSAARDPDDDSTRRRAPPVMAFPPLRLYVREVHHSGATFTLLRRGLPSPLVRPALCYDAPSSSTHALCSISASTEHACTYSEVQLYV
ncbi:hypothetical protein VPH35_124403 [Triticum aestivum]